MNNWFLTKVHTQFNGENIVFFLTNCAEQLNRCMYLNIYLNVHFSVLYKISLKIKYGPKGKIPRYRICRRKPRGKLSWCKVMQSVMYDTKSTTQKTVINYISSNFKPLFCERLVRRVTHQTTNCEKISANNISEKDLHCKYTKDFQNSTERKTIQFKNEQKTPRMLCILDYQWNVN